MHLSTTAAFALLPLIALAALALAHPESSATGPTAPATFPQIPAAATGPPLLGPPSGPTPPDPAPGAGLPSGPAPPTAASTPDGIIIIDERDRCFVIRQLKKSSDNPAQKYRVGFADCSSLGAIPDQGSSASTEGKEKKQLPIITNIFRQVPVAPSAPAANGAPAPDAGFTLATTVNGQELCIVRGNSLTARFYAKKCNDKSTKFTATPTTSKMIENLNKINAPLPSAASLPVVKLKFKAPISRCLAISLFDSVKGSTCTGAASSIKFRLVPVFSLTAPPAIGAPPAIAGTAIPGAASGTPPPPPSK